MYVVSSVSTVDTFASNVAGDGQNPRLGKINSDAAVARVHHGLGVSNQPPNETVQTQSGPSLLRASLPFNCPH